MNTIYFVRHGETINNVAKRNVPSTYNYEKNCPDPSLNETGIVQANLLGKRLQCCNINVIYSSDLLRTLQTTEIINEYLNKKVILRSDLREIDMGELHLRTFEELKDEFPYFYNNFNKHNVDMPYPNGESGSDVKKRVTKIIKEIVNLNMESTLVVTHGGVIRVLLSVFLGLPLENRFKFELNNCGITAVQYDAIKGYFKVICVNDSSHLEELKISNEKFA